MTRKTQTRSRRPDGASPASIWASTVLRGWDLWVSVAVGGGVAAISSATGEFKGGSEYYWPLVALCLTLAVGVWAVERWLADRLRSADYGELLGMADPDYGAVMAPYFVVEVIGFFAAVFAAVTAIIIEGLEGALAIAVVHGINAWLVSWTVLGVLSLFVVTNRHIRRQAEVSNLRKQYEAEQRMR